MMLSEEEAELYQNQRRLAMATIDDLTELKILLIEADMHVPAFVNNAISYLKKKYLVQDSTIGELLRKTLPIR
ncbi:MAG: hypothetical protein H7A25_18285 [Leptospiraceae bacterium]|nr:hypothetical protein [Leptospiraceae bacterium]MCP5501857.1 hypothetical protein [Leptospiraceae bacterium]